MTLTMRASTHNNFENDSVIIRKNASKIIFEPTLFTASADDRISANELTLLHKPYLMWENAVKKYFEVDKKRDSGGHDLLGQSDMTSYSRRDEEATKCY